MDTEKQFICSWDTLTYVGNSVQLHGTQFFTEDNGYSKEDIERINNLNIGEFYYPIDIDKSHVVVRVTNSPKHLAQI